MPVILTKLVVSRYQILKFLLIFIQKFFKLNIFLFHWILSLNTSRLTLLVETLQLDLLVWYFFRKLNFLYPHILKISFYLTQKFVFIFNLLPQILYKRLTLLQNLLIFLELNFHLLLDQFYILLLLNTSLSIV